MGDQFNGTPSLLMQRAKQLISNSPGSTKSDDSSDDGATAQRTSRRLRNVAPEFSALPETQQRHTMAVNRPYFQPRSMEIWQLVRCVEKNLSVR